MCASRHIIRSRSDTDCSHPAMTYASEEQSGMGPSEIRAIAQQGSTQEPAGMKAEKYAQGYVGISSENYRQPRLVKQRGSMSATIRIAFAMICENRNLF